MNNEKLTKNENSLRRHLHTDLADECCPENGGKTAAAQTPPFSREAGNAPGGRGFDYTEKTVSGYRIRYLNVNDDRGEAAVGKPVGSYVTADVGKLWCASDTEINAASRCISTELRSLASRMIAGSETGCVLVAGLGNREITSDSIGPETVGKLTVTRHLRESDPELFRKTGLGEFASIAPGVLAQTGIETAELIAQAVRSISPSLLVVIDSLAARSPDRLATTVQLCDTGIAPGSGIGNRRARIDRETMGVPVIAVGVPTVVRSDTFVIDALCRAGLEELGEKLEGSLCAGEGLYVALKDCDAAVDALSSLLADAIERAFSPAYSYAYPYAYP